MIELPSWVAAAVEVLYYAIAVPAWALLAVSAGALHGGRYCRPDLGRDFWTSPGRSRRG